MENKKVIEALKKTFPGKVSEIPDRLGDTVVRIEKDAVLNIMEFLKNRPCEFTMLLDLTCVDYISSKDCFEMVYHLFSISTNNRIRIKSEVRKNELDIDSLSSLWKNANWLEREIFDMFGINFKGHPDMQRLFMYEGFEGYPLRKDYPLRKRQPKIPLRKKT